MHFLTFWLPEPILQKGQKRKQTNKKKTTARYCSIFPKNVTFVIRLVISILELPLEQTIIRKQKRKEKKKGQVL